MQENKLFDREKYIKKYYKNISLDPFVLEKKQLLDIENATERIGELLNKTKRICFEDERVRDFFNFTKKQLEIIESSDSEMKLKVGRFDGFLTKENEFKFLELNTNFPGGVNRLELIDDKTINYTSEKLEKTGKLCKDFIEMIRKIKEVYCHKNKLLVIVYGSNVTDQEINSMKSIGKMLDKHLSNVKVCHWKDLEVKNNKLYLSDKEVGLIFRAVLLNRIWEYDYDVTKEIFELVRTNKIGFFNSTYDYIGSTKDIFALWYDKIFQDYLSLDEKNILKKYIPWTAVLDKNTFKSDKDNYILKPKDGYGGIGVVIGKSVLADEWDKIYKQHKNSGKYIIQEYIKPIEQNIKALNTHSGKTTKINAKINISPWCIDGKMSYISGRYSESDIINVKQGGGIISILKKL